MPIVKMPPFPVLRKDPAVGWQDASEAVEMDSQPRRDMDVTLSFHNPPARGRAVLAATLTEVPSGPLPLERETGKEYKSSDGFRRHQEHSAAEWRGLDVLREPKRLNAPSFVPFLSVSLFAALLPRPSFSPSWTFLFLQKPRSQVRVFTSWLCCRCEQGRDNDRTKIKKQIQSHV